MQTFTVPRIYTDALPRICKGKKCLNDAEKGIDLCLPCLRGKGMSDNDILIYHSRVKKKRTPADNRTIPSRPVSLGFDPDQTIYFIQQGDVGPIKIGVTRKLEDRLIALQTGNPAELRIIATISAPPALEPQLHAYFDEHRLMGEWFNPVDEVLEFAKLMRAGKLIEMLVRFEERIAEGST